MSPDLRLATVYVMPMGGRDAAEVVAASLDCLAEAAHKVSEAEVRRAKAQMKVSLVAALESPGTRAQQLARQMHVYGRPLPIEEMVARVEAISVEDVRKTGAAVLRSPPTIAAIGAVGRVPGQAKSAEALRGVGWRFSA
jgi:predicted Zn-dependent peptidase